MKRFLTIATLLICTITHSQVYAQSDSDSIKVVPKKFYWSNSMDMFLLSTSLMEKFPATSSRLTTLRFTYFFNIGFNLNYDFNNNIGLFTGVGIKNIGFIEKFPANDSTVKRRVYAIGVPLGIKIGNIRRHNYGFIGGGVDFPFNYKEKGYVRRGKKDKFNEWFSDRTEMIMPYVFAGLSYSPGITLKLQYYPGNFLNTGYIEPSTGTAVPVMPYANYTKTNLILLSVGFDIRYSKKSKRISVNDTP